MRLAWRWESWRDVRMGDVVIGAPKRNDGLDLVLRVRRTGDELYVNLLCLETGARWSLITMDMNWIRRL